MSEADNSNPATGNPDETSGVPAENQTGASAIDKTRLLYIKGVLMEALGFAPGELDGMTVADAEAAIGERAREMRGTLNRSENAIVMGIPIKVKLRIRRNEDPVEFEVKPLSMSEDAKWRELAEALRNKGRESLQKKGEQVTGLDTLFEAARMYPQDVIDMFWAYCPTAAAQRADIEAASTSVEIMVAAAEVLRFTSPFFSLLDRLGAAAMEAILPTE